LPVESHKAGGESSFLERLNKGVGCERSLANKNLGLQDGSNRVYADYGPGTAAIAGQRTRLNKKTSQPAEQKLAQPEASGERDVVMVAETDEEADEKADASGSKESVVACDSKSLGPAADSVSPAVAEAAPLESEEKSVVAPHVSMADTLVDGGGEELVPVEWTDAQPHSDPYQCDMHMQIPELVAADAQPHSDPHQCDMDMPMPKPCCDDDSDGDDVMIMSVFQSAMMPPAVHIKKEVIDGNVSPLPWQPAPVTPAKLDQAERSQLAVESPLPWQPAPVTPAKLDQAESQLAVRSPSSGLKLNRLRGSGSSLQEKYPMITIVARYDQELAECGNALEAARERKRVLARLGRALEGAPPEVVERWSRDRHSHSGVENFLSEWTADSTWGSMLQKERLVQSQLHREQRRILWKSEKELVDAYGDEAAGIMEHKRKIKGLTRKNPNNPKSLVYGVFVDEILRAKDNLAESELKCDVEHEARDGAAVSALRALAASFAPTQDSILDAVEEEPLLELRDGTAVPPPQKPSPATAKKRKKSASTDGR